MNDNVDYVDLIKQAQLGDRRSVGCLAQLAKPRLVVYTYRLTFDYHLAQDLSQDTLLEMISSLKRLQFEHACQFWAWLFRTALGKVQHHSRTKRNKSIMQMSSLEEEQLSQLTSGDHNDGVSNMIRKELSDAVCQAMAELKLRHRSILVLRCCEQLPYSQIADIMDCSELAAPVLFFRAKQALKRRLSRRGFGKGMLPMAMAMFTLLTGPADASSAAVTAAGTKAGVTATILGAAGTKLGAAILIAAAALIVGGLALSNAHNRTQRPGIPPVYSNDKVPQPSEIRSIRCLALNGRIERYYYFPDGIDGPMLARTNNWAQGRRYRQSTVLWDGQNNYVYCRDPNCQIHTYRTVCIRNHNVYFGIGITRRMPCDPPELTAFLNLIEGEVPDFEHVGVAYDTLDEAYFQPNWPPDAPVIDERDTMHKRGWTYFRIEGQIGDEQIQGWGRIPFTYDASREHPAWLRLKAGERLQIIDTASAACLVTADPIATLVYPSGTFFKGLARPWMGLHTIDIVRRDAAESRIEFDTQRIDDEKAQLTLWQSTGQRLTWATYLIDLERDIVETIEFLTSGDAPQEQKGRLRFTYLEDVEQAAAEFIEPGAAELSPKTRQEPLGISWLIELAQGTLGQ